MGSSILGQLASLRADVANLTVLLGREMRGERERDGQELVVISQLKEILEVVREAANSLLTRTLAATCMEVLSFARSPTFAVAILGVAWRCRRRIRLVLTVVAFFLDPLSVSLLCGTVGVMEILSYLRRCCPCLKRTESSPENEGDGGAQDSGSAKTVVPRETSLMRTLLSYVPGVSGYIVGGRSEAVSPEGESPA